MTKSIQIPFTNEVIANNRVIGITQADDTLWIDIEPYRAPLYERPDTAKPVAVEVYATDEIVVQELGLPGQQVRYRVHVKRVRYTNDAKEVKTFTRAAPGVNLRRGFSEAVIEKALYFLIDATRAWRRPSSCCVISMVSRPAPRLWSGSSGG
jgi:hypothetical protein